MAGVDIRTVQEVLGHKTLTMTTRYSHLSGAHLTQAVNWISKGTIQDGTDTKTYKRESGVQEGIV